jgi:hypothetical protein
MRHSVAKSALLLLATAGCAGRSIRNPPSPVPALPEPSVRISDTGPWAFSYKPDTIRLQITRSAAIESATDSGTHREISTNNTHEVLALAIAADTVRYTATVDSFFTASQGLIGSTEPVSLPVQVSGLLDSLNVSIDSTVQSCDPVRSNLETDVRNLLIPFPAQLTVGATWRDSVARVACYGTIPVRATVVRRFSVVGRTSFNGQSTLTVQRADSVTAHGEGRQQQHQLVVDVNGTGTATYYLIPELGRLMHLTTSQDLDFAIRASGRTSRFRESVKEEFSPLR